jgi:hypothetical protein
VLVFVAVVVVFVAGGLGSGTLNICVMKAAQEVFVEVIPTRTPKLDG